MFLRGPDGARVRAIVSIQGSREPAIEMPASVNHRLLLHFDDTETPDGRDLAETYRALIQKRRSEKYGRPLVAPTIDDAKQIIDFARSIQDMDGTLLCQC